MGRGSIFKKFRGFDNDDDFFSRDGFGKFGDFSSSNGGGFSGVSTSIKKTTQIM